jgi:hypothetical protein
MKKMTIAAVLAAQLSAAQPAFAAEPIDAGNPRMGAFGGLTVRVPLDGRAGEREVRAGLTLAPTLRSLTAEGAPRLRIGEGLELDVTGRRPATLRLAGQDVRRLGAAQPDGGDEDDQGGGPSTIGWIAIGVGAVVVTGAGLWALCFSGTVCNLDGE